MNQREQRWHITAQAVSDYLTITIRGSRVAGDRNRAIAELTELARVIVDARKPGTELASGDHQFRGPRPLRLRMIVSYRRHPESDLPRLIAVKPDHEGRMQPYTRSAPERTTGHTKRSR